MKIQQVRYFLALADKLNFTRAAEICNVSQSALTRAIKTLEDELGGALCHRETSQTQLSELGRLMLPYFQAIHDQTQAAKEHAESLKQTTSVELKLVAMCTLGPSMVSNFIMQFHQKNEDVRLHVQDAVPAALTEALLRGDFQVGLTRTTGNLDDRFHAIPLFTERFVIVLPKGHDLLKKDVVRFEDLDNQSYVARTNCEMAVEGAQLAEGLGIHLPVVFQSERDDWVLSMVEAGLGFGFFPEFSVLPDSLEVRPLNDPIFERTISLITVKGRLHTPAVGAFVRGARSHSWPITS